MKTIFKKGGVTIKSIHALNRGCPECYFGVECKNGNWNCNSDIAEWKIPDCVYDYGIDKNIIYIEI